MSRLALTPGEPAGIGPDLTVMLAQQPRNYELVAIADPAVLTARAAQLGLPLEIRPFDQKQPSQGDPAGRLCCAVETVNRPVHCGELNTQNATYVLRTLDVATAGCLSGQFDAMVTGPVHKGVINDAGIAFTGHTEYLAQRTRGNPVMMLVAGKLRVALATTHLPLSAAPAALNADLLITVLTTLQHDLQAHFGIANPRILVCGLNPHAGESGHLGDEEINIIEPVIKQLGDSGMQVSGPLPADTLFTPQYLDTADAVLAMYHDQGLPVLKYAGFGQAVNVTLGLPIIRTSVDHGTALDKAGGSADIQSGSLQAAIDLALKLAEARAQAD